LIIINKYNAREEFKKSQDKRTAYKIELEKKMKADKEKKLKYFQEKVKEARKMKTKTI